MQQKPSDNLTSVRRQVEQDRGGSRTRKILMMEIASGHSVVGGIVECSVCGVGGVGGGCGSFAVASGGGKGEASLLRHNVRLDLFDSFGWR